jgi:hypothetical protein
MWRGERAKVVMLLECEVIWMWSGEAALVVRLLECDVVIGMWGEKQHRY